MVIKDGSGDGREQAESRRDERARNTGADRAKTGTALSSQVVERANDTPHRAEQADERGHRSRGSQPWHVSFQFGQLLAHAQLQGTFHSGAAGDPSSTLHLALHFFGAEIEDAD